ncbi:hypothetical protein BLNAU_2247 [Blattamonas nauphoetae]|uniref:RRM domain-containing protein n=1 Tax=Blattamonas nauphoetae TaxID=2049346 RepID=A0ABQ9YGC4_9EUKA|nr:hypothetical protein BLNAU_2247 [Blattamonas nauphoetae]
MTENTKIFVSKFPQTVTLDTLQTLFASCGTIVATKEKFLRKQLHHVIFTFQSAAEAQSAVEKFNSHDMDGSSLRVEFVQDKPKESKKTTPEKVTTKKGFVVEYQPDGTGTVQKGKRKANTEPKTKETKREKKQKQRGPLSNTRLHLRPIPKTLHTQELADLLKEHKVKEVFIPASRFEWNVNLGYCFVEFEDEAECAKFLEKGTFDIQGTLAKLEKSEIIERKPGGVSF